MQVNINRQLLGVEDLLWGTGTASQIRNGESVLVTKINQAFLTPGIQFMAQTANGPIVIPDGANAFSIDSLTLVDGASITVPDTSIYKIL